MMLIKEDVERIIENMIRDNLTLKVERGSFVDPNSRTIKLVLSNEVISSITIDVSDMPEYEDY